ncbi:metallophosphoesterase [Mesorhizobium loti]|uniref:metallophosphoesterase n=1 Tax=Rhizobium loti TaxID=381 RepID=UPI00047C13D7|nr:metallophosphoesterase [Mesorhizobium loti]
MAFDIVADIHGYAGTLTDLLAKMDYSEGEEGWSHPDRQVIFLGDFVDRGPRQEETYRIVRKMIENGKALAVMGNHEFNATAWMIADPTSSDNFLRSHSAKNRSQHASFLNQVVEGSALHAEMIAWFWQLPLWLELDKLLVVHAAWDEKKMNSLKPLLAPGNKLTACVMQRYCEKSSETYYAIETILKGVEADLPPGASFTDKDGHSRSQIRLKWWESGPSSYRDAALMAEAVVLGLADELFLNDPRQGHSDHRPVFIGHHALSGTPKLTSAKVACLDFSVVNKDGFLCAYRWSGETELRKENLLSVPVRA